MSPFQQAQMFSLQDPNIHNIAVQGVFDDCQDIVKAVSSDLAFKREHRIGTVNSINWARLLAQVVYYFAGYFQATKSNSERVSFAVPSGNFGNVCAGHVARSMGLPSTNWWWPPTRTTCWTSSSAPAPTGCAARRRPSRPPARRWTSARPATSSASCSTCWAATVRAPPALFGQAVPHDGGFALGADEFARIAGFGFSSGKSTHADRLATIRSTWQQHGVMIDTHTADGLKVAMEQRRPGVPMLVLETALPAKFAQTIREALGREPERPAALQGIEALPKRFEVMPVDAAAVKRYIALHTQH